MQFEHRSKNKWKRAHLFLEIAQKATMLVGFDCFPFLAMVKKAATLVWVRLLSVNNGWFDDQLFPCRYENRIDPWLSAFLSFYVYIFFWRKNLFLTGTKSRLMFLFFSVFSLLFLLCFLCSIFLWVNCSVFLGFFCCCRVLWVAMFLRSSPPLFSGFLLPFIEIPKLPPLTSPAFAGLLFATNEIVGERRDARLDRIRCRFSACWIGMEKMNTIVPPATATFR